MLCGSVLCKIQVVTLHVSVWVEMLRSYCGGRGFASRSTWACELKSRSRLALRWNRRHAPRERVSWNCNAKSSLWNAWRSRSTWACELKYKMLLKLAKTCSHAPRERVSWNPIFSFLVTRNSLVTLHVSVWVEIFQIMCVLLLRHVTLHVSVWVEICNRQNKSLSTGSRSTWACELKLFTFFLSICII